MILKRKISKGALTWVALVVLAITILFLIERGTGNPAAKRVSANDSHQISKQHARPHRKLAPRVSPKKESESIFAQFIGLQIQEGDDKDLKEKWAESLSRNPLEKEGRLTDLKHAKKSEVVSFEVPEEKFKELHGDIWPVEMTIPSFTEDGGTEISVYRADMESTDAGIIFARLKDQPEVSVVLSVQPEAISGMIESADRLARYDPLDSGITILRELDADSAKADFHCEKCESGEH